MRDAQLRPIHAGCGTTITQKPQQPDPGPPALKFSTVSRPRTLLILNARIRRSTVEPRIKAIAVLAS